jgi:Cell division protein CrgA
VWSDPAGDLAIVAGVARGKTGAKSDKTPGKPGSKGATSGRYTPPTPKTVKHSPLWVPVAMFTSMGAGVGVIVLNYLQLLPGGEARNGYLILGLVLLIAGFVLSTRFR